MRSTHVRFHAVRLVEHNHHLVALASSEEGLSLRQLDALGIAVGPELHLGPPCRGGLDALSRAGRLLVACLGQAHTEAGQAGTLLLLEIGSDGSIERRAALEHAGRDARGVSIALAGDTVAIAWQSGEPQGWKVWRTELDADGALGEPRLLSDPRLAAGAPHLAPIGDELWSTWAETWIDAGFPAGRVLVSRGGAPMLVATVDHDSPEPRIVDTPRGPVLFFRDFRRPNRHASLYAQRLLGDGSAAGEPKRVARADAEGGPRPIRCGPMLFAVASRSWGKSDVLVGINVLSERLRRRVPEQQLYEWSAQFERADAACRGDELLLLVAERGDAIDSTAGALTIPLRCR